MRIELNTEEVEEALFRAAQKKAGLGDGTFIYEVTTHVHVDQAARAATVEASVEIEYSVDAKMIA